MTGLAALILALIGLGLALAAWTVMLTRLQAMTGPALVLVLSLAGTAISCAAIIIASAGLS